MMTNLLSSLSLLLVAAAAIAGVQLLGWRARQLHRVILERGEIVTGRVTAVCGAQAKRVYFEFEPRDASGRVHACHVTCSAQHGASLPNVGTAVDVRYLPKDPRTAVIASFVATSSAH